MHNNYTSATSDAYEESSTKDTIHGSAFLVGKTCLFSYFQTDWVLDSGATYHKSCDMFLFDDYKVVSSGEHRITIPDGNKVQVTHIGSTIVNGVSLQEVLYVPGFKFNLISIPKLCKDLNYEVIFIANACFIQVNENVCLLVSSNVGYMALLLLVLLLLLKFQVTSYQFLLLMVYLPFLLLLLKK